MPFARDEAGNIWEVDAQGNPVRLAQAAQSLQSQPMTIGQPDPTMPSRVSKGNSDAVVAGAQANVAPRLSQAELDKAVAEAQAAQAKAQAAVKEQAIAPSPATAKLQQSIQTDNVLESIAAARRQIGEGWATGNLAGTRGFQGIPFVGQNSANLAATLSGIEGSVINDTLKQLKAASASGASGLGALSEKEGQRLAASVAALQQTQDEQSLKENLARVERHYRNALALLNNENPYDPAVAKKYGIQGASAPMAGSQTPPSSPGSPPSTGGAPGGGMPPGGSGPTPGAGGPEAANLTSRGAFQADPALAGVNAKVASMIRAGHSAQDVRAYLERIRPGLGAQAQNIDQAVAYYNQHPQTAPNVDVEKVWKPASGISQTLGDIGMTAPGSALIGAADTLSGGLLDNMTGNPDLTRATMKGLSQVNPNSYAAGQIGGGVLGAMGAEAGLARAGLASPLAADALTGAAYNAGSADDPNQSRVAAALLGATTGALGGVAGRGIARVAGGAATGVREGAQNFLNDRGIRMTPGQILGGRTKGIEDRLAGLPFIGDVINNARREGVQDFNRAAFDEGLAPIGASTGGVIAEPGIDAARALRSNAYSNALDPVTLQADAPFIADMQGVIQAGQALPEPMLGNIQYTLPTRVGEAFDASGQLTGRDYQQALRGLRRDSASVANQPYGWDFGQVTQAAEGALGQMVERQAPGVVEALTAANRANTNVETLRSAVNAARNGSRSHQPGVFMPSQLSDAASQTAKRFGNSQGTTNQPFYELTRAGQEVLPSQVPDSGTAGRMVIPLLAASLGGTGGAVSADGTATDRAVSGAGAATVAALLASAPYSATSRALIQRALLAERPDVLQRGGQMLIDRSGIAGRLAAPSAVLYLDQ